MYRPDINKMTPKDESVFSLVAAVAMRAREINNELEAKKRELIEENSGKLPTDLGPEYDYLNEKPVTVSLKEIAENDISYRSAMSYSNKIY